jgi:predicted DNA-binding protein|tara:strand:- start:196886 stop:197221 length:336 start_codon:yes stop_codon:yes gene_type:complete
MGRDNQFHLRIDKNIFSKLTKISKKEGRNISDVIREAIAEYLMTRNYLNDDASKKLQKKIKNPDKTIENIIESLAESYYRKNLNIKKISKRKSKKDKNKTIEEILESLIDD